MNHASCSSPSDTDQERSLSRGNCRKWVIKCEGCMGAELNPSDKRFSLTIISTHWFEKWSLALTSGRAGVWDEVQLTNLNLQNKVNEKKIYTLYRHAHALCYHRHGHDKSTTTKTTESKKNQEELDEADYIQHTLKNDCRYVLWEKTEVVILWLLLCLFVCLFSRLLFVSFFVCTLCETNKTEWKLSALCLKYCELLKPNENTGQAIVFYPAICHND